MSSGVHMLRVLLFLLDVGGAQVLATNFKYAIIGAVLGIAISAGFLALKICMIRKHLSDNDSSDMKSTPQGVNETILRKKRPSRDAQVMEL
ncbi:transmembrane protein 273 isoform X2 [Nannospalax galili]|uniref:transmembrane protein 273 isoform X2 n=1 Tax=Nannospalax galili TaxID=1026970 RepID=UPI00111C32B3|nr:transmembrane protein 273 isoform X2 [Nannospalax galili]